jgi:hypothetical protein
MVDPDMHEMNSVNRKETGGNLADVFILNL